MSGTQIALHSPKEALPSEDMGSSGRGGLSESVEPQALNSNGTYV